MKITIENIPEGSEPEIILRCHEPDDSLLQLIYALKSPAKRLIGTIDGQIHILEPKDVLYFESVDSKVFIYLKDHVYETKMRLYEIEAMYGSSGFFRASKSAILNLTKIESISPVFDGRFKACLQNGEMLYISRQYVPALKHKLGL